MSYFESKFDHMIIPKDPQQSGPPARLLQVMRSGTNSACGFRWDFSEIPEGIQPPFGMVNQMQKGP